MAKNLVIVESPAKARTIERFLGKDYSVKSSFGHIRDLPKKGLNIDIEKDFEPKYEVSADKKKVVSELKKAALGSEVWLASDEDREGEAIAWHLTQALKLDPAKTKRIVFHEITQSAIEAAIKNPRTVDIKLVDAQQARRVLDRLVGYELSPVLWKKVRTGLSAGRVQSVAVRLIVERERAIRDFTPESSFKVKAVFEADGQQFEAELKDKLADESTAGAWLEKALGADFKVKDIEQKPGSRNPAAPFTTSTLQQEASRRLGFSVRQTMTLAQRLYEAGHITYMRTDSTVLSGQAIKAAESYIKDKYGDKYHQVRQFKTKNANAQEAHEAIRPTSFSQTDGGDDESQRKLYQLIWQRALASQMSQAQMERTEVSISVSTQPQLFVAKGEILRFDGFMKVYGGTKDDTLLPPLKQDQALTLSEMSALETFSRPPARYSEATLVRQLEELGIGRPSTYAPTISTIQTRGYVEKTDLEGTEREIIELKAENSIVTSHKTKVITGADRAKLVPTAIAEVTTDFLVKYFPSVTDYDFTARVEGDFDEIAQGKQPWRKMIADFYQDFHPLVEKSEDVPRNEVSQARELGTDPKSGEPIYSRYGRYGPMLLKGHTEDESKKPQFAPLPTGTTIDTVTLEQALEMFKLPRTVGKTADGQEIKANIGRFGPYIQVDKTFVSIKPLDPQSITEAEALQLYETKLVKDAAKNIKEFASGIKILNGPYGPYVTDGKKNARIAKDQDPTKLTEADAKALLDAAPAKKRGSRRRKKTA
ncbi:MAG TPA: type I DNA topoisomerase [Candidatus Saccharimonadales bacterium]|jgi:DNA topoisomerase-1|nr:type I DNA topoisomerase [Candidatus Saccharimonadales bacterium]